ALVRYGTAFKPEHLVIVGGSYIGLEFAQMYRRFGSRVTVVEMGNRLIARDDDDVSAEIKRILEAEGVDVRLNAECIAFAKRGDGVAVTVEFGRPHVRDRQIWGELVPYDKVWRTGADEATTISFAEPVTVEGQPLDAGTYSLFTIPGEGKWTVIFNRKANQWGAYKYDAGEDALRVLVMPRTLEHVEVMDFEIDGADVVLRWADLAVPFTVAAP
ncbi:MAG: DUF2911 domain-containing protein, partial [Acidobacteriota bacterium]